MPDLITRSLAFPAIEPEARLLALNQQARVDDGIGLDRCWRVMRRHWRMMIALVLLAMVVAGGAVFLMTPQYTAQSSLLIEPEPPQLLDVKQLISASGSTEDHDYYKTQFELLKSRDLAGRVISDLDLLHNKTFNSIGRLESVINFILARIVGLFGSTSPPISAKDDEVSADFDIINLYLAGLKIEPVAGTRLVTISV